jgi:hypothetical protein
MFFVKYRCLQVSCNPMSRAILLGKQSKQARTVTRGQVQKHFFQRALFELKHALPNLTHWLDLSCPFGFAGLG